MDVPYLIRRAAGNFPGAPLASDGTTSLTLAEAVNRGERFANSLDDLDVSPGGSIGILMENRTEYAQADIGISLGRRVRVALNARLHLDDFRFMVEDASIEALVHSSRFAEEATALAEEFGLIPISVDENARVGESFSHLVAMGPGRPHVRPGCDEDPAWITYTSGTTGRPKGVVLSHRSIRQVAFNLLLELGPVRPGQKVVLPQPLSHGAGYFLLPYAISGGGIRIMDKFDADEALAIAEREDGVSTLKVVPAMMPMLLEAADRHEFNYETLIYGAAPIPPQVLDASLDRFGAVLVQIYGQSEAPVTLTCLHKEDHLGDGEQRFSAGRPWCSTLLEVRDGEGRPVQPGEIGEVVVSGRHLMSGYHGMEEATDRVFSDGVIHTRDVARLDERGFVYLLGRSDEMINSGGFNISPREVEHVIGDFPEVGEVAVLGIENERWGHIVSAVVRPADGCQVDPGAITELSKPRLGFRTPKLVVVVDEIPKTGNGKVDVNAMRRDLESRSP
jgi:fatty-acyl-CoA synthase